MVLKLLRLYSQETILSMEKITMRSFVVAVGLGASLLLFSGQADAQYKYTDDKGVSKVTQYKLDIPESYRDAAVWVGPTGVGKPGLSKEAEQTKLREDAYRRIGEAEAQLVPYKQAEAARAAAQREADAANAAAAEARQAKKAAAAAAQRERREDARAEESLRLQREAVELQRQQAQTDQIRQSNEMYRQLYRGR